MGEAEFEAIYTKHFDGIYRFLSKLCPNPDLCEEMTQETFYQAYISLHRYNGKCEMFTWLAAIAKNTYFKYLRKIKLPISTLSWPLCPTRNTRPSICWKSGLRRQHVREAVRKLPPKYRDVVILQHLRRPALRRGCAPVGHHGKLSQGYVPPRQRDSQKGNQSMSTNCDIIRDLLPLYVDGTLSEASAELVREHLRECHPCRLNYRQLKPIIKNAVSPSLGSHANTAIFSAASVPAA